MRNIMAVFRNISQQAEECDEIRVAKMKFCVSFLTVRAAH